MISSSCAFSVTVPKLSSAHSSVRRLLPSVPLTYRSFVHNPPICLVGASIGVNPKKFECRTKLSTAEMATNKGKGEVKLFDSGEDLAVSLAKYIADLSDKFAKERGAFSIVFSGGSLFNSLRFLKTNSFFLPALISFNINYSIFSTPKFIMSPLHN